MSQHTPGPWRVEQTGRQRWVVIGDVADGAVASVVTGFHPGKPADVDLIAAAPELLEVLQRFEAAMRSPASPIRVRALEATAGYTPAEILDENSPIRDRIRAYRSGQ